MFFIGFGIISISSYVFSTYVDPRLEPGRVKAAEELKSKIIYYLERRDGNNYKYYLLFLIYVKCSYSSFLSFLQIANDEAAAKVLFYNRFGAPSRPLRSLDDMMNFLGGSATYDQLADFASYNHAMDIN